MQLWDIFLNTLQLPRKKAMFTLNRTGMDLAIIYLCLLTIIAAAPGFIERAMTGFGMNVVFYVIYFFIFYYLPLLIMLMAALALAAYAALLLARIQQRKFRFQTLWKLAVYTATYPILLSALLTFFLPQKFILWGNAVFVVSALSFMIQHYPKRVQKS